MNPKLALFLKQCKKSVTFFIEKCCKVKHPTIGIMPFQLFSYQKKCLSGFKENRFSIFKKTRQCGISTLTGAYALWVAMFFPYKTILIVSKTDEDAKNYLSRNVRFVFDNLPKFMRDLWDPVVNEHQMTFKNGSTIKSLTGSPNTLRSNAASLNIIDESAFIQDMEGMWASGQSTLMHGGSVIVISTTNGIGGWYWTTWTGAKEKSNNFHPIEIDWWDMDWALEYTDHISGKKMRIAPRDGIRECKTKEEYDKYGPYWSPWLEDQYRQLQMKGEAHLFKQEVIAEFLGSGGTIVPTSTLKFIGDKLKDYVPEINNKSIRYQHPITGEEEDITICGMDPLEGLYVWDKPVHPTPATKIGSRVIKAASEGHLYVVGADTATGQNNDYSAIEVYDINTMEQVAEYMGKISLTDFSKLVDYIGRWYNNAMVCLENTGIGYSTVENLQLLNYPNLWRKKKLMPNGQIQLGPIGFATSEASKPTLNKFLVEYLSDSDEEGKGYKIKSARLLRQLQIYIRKKNRQGMDTGKTGAQTGRGNHDDLVLSTAMAFMAAEDAADAENRNLLPVRASNVEGPELVPFNKAKTQMELIKNNDNNILMPYSLGGPVDINSSIDAELEKFTDSLTQRVRDNIPAVKEIKRYY